MTSFCWMHRSFITNKRMEEHSLGLLAAILGTVIIFFFGFIVNLSHLTLQYSSFQLLPEILQGGVATNETSIFKLPVSLASWSTSIWGVVYVCQTFWLAYALAGICRRTALGPAYNNPKLLPVQVYLFFSVAILSQVGWLILLEKNQVAFALVVILLSTGLSLISLTESYRSLVAALPILHQEERTFDLWAVRLVVQNALAFFFAWVMLHATLTFTDFLTFGMETTHVGPRTGALVQLSVSGFLVFVYFLGDLTTFDKYSRYVVTPYLAFALFHAAQLNKDWPSTHTTVFIFLAVITSFTFLAFLVKVIVLLWRHVAEGEKEGRVGEVMSRPLTSDLEEEMYLLEQVR